MNVARLAAAALLVWGALELLRRARDGYDTFTDPLGGALADLAASVDSILPESLSMWTNDQVPDKYRAAVLAAESRYGLPDGMLGRLLWQESRYRPEIIDGRVRSSAGALGIAQFMPATAAELGVDPLDPFQAIDGAGRYLSRLYRSTGSWDKALASYNWGIGNVTRKGLAVAPAETRDYFSQILADLGLGGTIA